MVVLISHRATFAYLGTELVGVTVGEAQNPRKTIPRAIKLTFYRILIFYCLSVLLLGMIIPYNSKELAFANDASTSASASPFVVAIKLAGINALPGILNGCIMPFRLLRCEPRPVHRQPYTLWPCFGRLCAADL